MNVVDMPGKGMPDLRAAGDASTFFERGYLDPFPLLTTGQRQLLLSHLTSSKRAKPAAWTKDRAVRDRLFYEIATDRRLLDVLRPLLGESVILWGVAVVRRRPGQSHPWHVDIESAAPNQRFASVWIGLTNTSQASGMAFISRSHGFSKTIQEVQWTKQFGRGDAADDMILAWGKEFDPLAELVQPAVSDGEAVVFDGRIWHGTLNRREEGTRIALLLQYASTDAPVMAPDFSQLEWPFKFLTDPRPPVIVVSGKGNGGANRQVHPPAAHRKGAERIVTEVQASILPLEGDAEKGWRPHHLFNGLTAVHDDFRCHASVLAPGKMPHPPHAHIEEEILIVLDGQAELLIGDGPDVEQAAVHPVMPGNFVFYPAYQHHTLRNAGSGSLTYLMFKWRGPPIQVKSRLATRIFDPADRPPKPTQKAFQTWLLAEGPTNFLEKLHVHYSEVAPGGGYEPHADKYDVAIVVLAGRVETLGRTVEPSGLVFYAAHELHGLRNVGTETARYLVFEFHGAGSASRKRPAQRAGSQVAKSPKDGKPSPRKKTLLKRLEKLLMAPIRHFTRKR